VGTDDQLIFPVGHYVGAQYRVPESGDATQQVRRGAVFHSLTDEQFTVWTLGHGSTEAVRNEMRWQRPSIEELAKAGGLTEAGGIIEELIELGLLVEVTADTELEFAERHRIVPLMLGLGNSADEPDLFGIGFLNQPVLQVAHAIYDLWQWSTMDDTLWATCENAADVARRGGFEYTEPAKLLTGFLGSLHALLITDAAYVDVDFRLGQVR